MAQNRPLTSKQRIAITELIAGASIAQAARAAGVRRKTASRWLNEVDAFAAAVDAGRAAVQAEQVRAIVAVQSTAWESARLAFESVNAQLKSGALVPRPREAKALLDAAVTASAIEMPAPEAGEASNMTLREQLELVGIRFAGILGQGPRPARSAEPDARTAG